MKKWMAVCSALLYILLLAGCTQKTGGNIELPQEEGREVLQEETPGTEETQTELPQAEKLETPPELTVRAGEAQIVTGTGSYSWTYDVGDGTSCGVEACGIHPLDGQGTWKVLPVTGVEVDLDWGGYPPDEISVQCWSTDHWGDWEAAAETVLMENGAFVLRSSGYVYEVSARWENNGSCGGSAYYVFVAE